jgi:hypothetical protein
MKSFGVFCLNSRIPAATGYVPIFRTTENQKLKTGFFYDSLLQYLLG